MLKIVTWGLEATVITTLAVSSYHVAFADVTTASDYLSGVSLLTVAALECSRVPVALNLTRQRLTGFLLSGVMLAGLSAITFEAATMAYGNLITQRTRAVVAAEQDQAKALSARATANADVIKYNDLVKQRTDALATARKYQTDIAQTVVSQSAMPTQLPMPVYVKPVPQPVPAPVMCRINGKKGSYTVICNRDAIAAVNKANADAERKAQEAYEADRAETIKKNGETQTTVGSQNRDAQAAHDAADKAASDAVKDAEAKLAAVGPAPDMHAYDRAIEEANQRVIDARATNPMYQVAADWQKVPVQQLTSDQFDTVKHWAVLGLAGATATTSTLLAVIASLLDRPNTPSKLNRMLRAWIARRRKPIVTRVDVPGPIEYQDREVPVPGPERIVLQDVVKEVPVPGPERIKEVVKEVPGPIEYRPAPGPIEYRDAPGPERVVERIVTKWVPYDVATGLRIKSDGTLGEVANLRSVQ
jgi:hypothetical protein